uniref:Uncharacterized protein n=1 Tax=Spermophilus dauricus TaxID=99837 RepID=A0A8C9PZT7_SPEDA
MFCYVFYVFGVDGVISDSGVRVGETDRVKGQHGGRHSQCSARMQRKSEDEESIVGDGETKEPFLLVQYSAKGPCVERKAKLMTSSGPEVHG